MTDQALDAVESDPLERMIGILDEEEGDPTGDEPAHEEPEDEEEAAEETEEEEAPKETEIAEVLIHKGQEKPVTKAELKELAQQGFDYTQKTQELAEERRAVEQERQFNQQQAQFQAQFTDHLAQAKAVESQLAQYKAVDWSAWAEQVVQLSQSDPYQAQGEMAKYQAAQQKYQQLKDAHNETLQTIGYLQQQAQQTAAQQQAQRLQQEAQAMRQAIPEWKDQARANAEMTELKQFLAQAGFGEHEIASVSDHRHVTLARKAMLYDKLVAQGKQKVATAPPPTAKPGSTAKPNTDGKKIREALKTTGKGEYAAKLIERML